jgi:hypothetical protein
MANNLSIPNYQTALWVNKPGPDAELELHKDVPVPTLKSNEILVKIQYSGLWYGTPNRSHRNHTWTNLVMGPATPIFTIYLAPIPWVSISLAMKGSVQW